MFEKKATIKYELSEILEIAEKAKRYDIIVNSLLDNAEVYCGKNDGNLQHRLYLSVKEVNNMLQTYEPERYANTLKSKLEEMM